MGISNGKLVSDLEGPFQMQVSESFRGVVYFSELRAVAPDFFWSVVSKCPTAEYWGFFDRSGGDGLGGKYPIPSIWILAPLGRTYTPLPKGIPN